MYVDESWAHNIGLLAQSPHSHRTVTAQSPHSHSTVTAQSQSIGLQAPISHRHAGHQVEHIARHVRMASNGEMVSQHPAKQSQSCRTVLLDTNMAGLRRRLHRGPRLRFRFAAKSEVGSVCVPAGTIGHRTHRAKRIQKKNASMRNIAGAAGRNITMPGDDKRHAESTHAKMEKKTQGTGEKKK